MDDYTARPFANIGDACGEPFSIDELIETKKDRLHYKVEEIFWLGLNYAVYRSEKGMSVQFSDCHVEAKAQRSRFTEISPELCELRHLTSEMRSRSLLGYPLRASRKSASLYEQDMAEAVMLVMEEKSKEGKRIARQALRMAVERVTNDNTVTYFAWCLLSCVKWSAVGLALAAVVSQVPQLHAPELPLHLHVVAAMFGATGAMLSVASRLQSFQLEPCHQSSMNILMGYTRIGFGFLASPVLLLLASTSVDHPLGLNPTLWTGAAVIGLIGGFAERLIPNILLRTASQIQSPAGTPVQAARMKEMELGAAHRLVEKQADDDEVKTQLNAARPLKRDPNIARRNELA
jgi:hypothetical protein